MKGGECALFEFLPDLSVELMIDGQVIGLEGKANLCKRPAESFSLRLWIIEEGVVGVE
jgi:hypothetical protein